MTTTTDGANLEGARAKAFSPSNTSAANGTVCLAATRPVSGLFHVAAVAVILPLKDGKMGMTLDRAMRIRQVRAYVAARKN